MTRTRVTGPVIGGAGTILVIAVLLGNPWVVDAIARREGFANAKLGPLVQYLTFPSWRVSPLRAASIVPNDLSTLVLLAAAAGLIAVAVRPLDPRRAGFAAVIAGWWAIIPAGALAGLLRGLLFNA